MIENLEDYRELSADLLKSITPRAKQEIITNLVLYEDELTKAEIVGIRKRHFLAQLAHESDGFKVTEEYASGSAYEGREDLGNTEPGDGVRFKGRGLIQLTGRYNYRKYGKLLGIPLEESPETAAKFPVALLTGILYWTQNGLNKLADANNLEAITRRINGGLNGLNDRRHYLIRFTEAGVGGLKI